MAQVPALDLAALARVLLLRSGAASVRLITTDGMEMTVTRGETALNDPPEPPRLPATQARRAHATPGIVPGVETYELPVGHTIRKRWRRREGKAPVQLVVELTREGWVLRQGPPAVVRQSRTTPFTHLTPLVKALYRWSGRGALRRNGKVFFGVFGGLGERDGTGG